MGADNRLLSLKNINVRQGNRTVLDNVTLHVDAGEIVTIVGPNGSGKSTLLKAIIGALPLAGGTMVRGPNLRVGYVPQRVPISGALPLTVRRFLDMPGRVTNTAAHNALTRVGAADLADAQMAHLSGGQLQRALLARALLEDPTLLILDEATQGLDQQGSAQFYALIDTLRQETGCGVLMVSHELHVVMAASDRVICLNGHVCCHGAPETVATAPAYRALFGSGTQGALALYRHDHNHSHEH